MRRRFYCNCCREINCYHNYKHAVHIRRLMSWKIMCLDTLESIINRRRYASNDRLCFLKKTEKLRAQGETLHCREIFGSAGRIFASHKILRSMEVLV